MSYRMHWLVCGGTGCVSSRSDEIITNLREVLKREGLENEVQVVTTGCFGFCEQGPIVKVYPDNVLYVQVKPEDAEELVKEHAIKGRPVQRLLYVEPIKGEKLSEHRDIPFYHSQIRIALRNCGIIDPEQIDDYIAVQGYEALGTVLSEKTPEDVIDTVTRSGLRG